MLMLKQYDKQWAGHYILSS